MDAEGKAKMKIGVLGGTFDPVHLGHLAMAQEARKALGLREVLFIPAGVPVLRREAVSPPEMRLKMLELALARMPYAKVSRIEIDRPGPSYTVDTLMGLKRIYGDDAEIYFILGWDSLGSLARWHRPQDIVRMCYLVAVPRPGYPRPTLEELEKDIPGIRDKVIFLEKPQLDISASTIRHRVAEGKPFAQLVPAAVAKYITANNLYKV